MKIFDLLFEDRKRESSGIFKVLKRLYTPLVVVIVILSFIFGLDFFIGSALIIGAVTSLLEGIEGLLIKDTTKRILTDFSLAALFLLIYFF
ncbi:hypothetical protein FZW96_07960 [Bacillus sp. BGMRC 2118]|nr:hypothetical protein FZW96_07960 [Bacillus sp. BGMRC 2118]